jgi:hypothetical protein
VRRVWQVTFACEASGAEAIHHYYQADHIQADRAVESAVRQLVHDEGFMVEPGTGRPIGAYGSLTVRVLPDSGHWNDWSPDDTGARCLVRWLACPADEVLEAIAVAMRGGA